MTKFIDNKIGAKALSGTVFRIDPPFLDAEIPCFQKQVLPAKSLLHLKYLFLEIQIGFAKKHITYHLFMQNFKGLAQAVWLPHDFE